MKHKHEEKVDIDRFYELESYIILLTGQGHNFKTIHELLSDIKYDFVDLAYDRIKDK